MTCGHILNCSLCQMMPGQKEAWKQRHTRAWGDKHEPAIVPEPAFEAQGQLAQGFTHAPDGAGRVRLASENSRAYHLRLCAGCYERVMEIQQ